MGFLRFRIGVRSSCVALSKIELIQAHKEDDTKRKKVRAMNKMTVAAALVALAVGAAAEKNWGLTPVV